MTTTFNFFPSLIQSPWLLDAAGLLSTCYASQYVLIIYI
jgi:hypothetical protein